ncbi:acyl-CoA thioesterase [Aeromicrobium sp. CF4.19]|uniref:acyl-CoA thioesterase n=1 Tax=Aeromicrobium sp. CF4.19 TaxID=3373082 RepID=UPI003EE527E1
MSSPADQHPGRPLAEYPAQYSITTRWEDEDVYGHVNNVVYYSFFDTAVNGWLIEATGTDIRQLDSYGIVAESGCRFLRELHFPGDVVAGLRVERLGTASITWEIALFQGDEESPAAVGHFVHVYVTGQDRSVTRVPALVRDVVTPLT